MATFKMVELPPFAIFYLGATVALITRGGLRTALLLAIPVVTGLYLLGVTDGLHWQIQVFDYTLAPYRVDKLSMLFGYLFSIATFLGILFSSHVRDTLQHVSGLLYAGSALGAVFAGDLITLFVFWELLAITSVALIWARRTPQAISAGIRYLVIQVLSGVLLLAGTLMHLSETGSIAFDFVGLESLSGGLIFVAFGIKCAFPMLHNWLTDAYPQATPTGTVFLSAFTTKTAVYALARGFPGTELLVYIGATMTCFPIFYAVIENDLRRVLAYSMINQIGFMVCGIGIGTALAVNGAVAHAFNDVIFKGLLFMSMGAVLHMTGRMNGSELGGLYKSMPITATFCIVGAASISAFPLFSGFVSKSLVMTAALQEKHPWVWLMLLFASAGVFHHAGIKIPFFAFFAHDAGIRTTDPPLNMLLAMGMAAGLCVFIGSYPWLLYELLPFGFAYTPYDATHVLAQIQLLLFSALAFTWLKLSGLYPPERRGVNLDVEWSYRRLIPQATYKLLEIGRLIDGSLHDLLRHAVTGFIRGWSRYHKPQGILARTWPTGSIILWVALLLAAYLVLYEL
jgi:multicomponent Na+:H+ antiporter subunit D